MKSKHIEAQRELCFKSGRNIRMQESDFKELFATLKEEVEANAPPAPNYDDCLPEGWFWKRADEVWMMYNNDGSWMGGCPTKAECIAKCLKFYRDGWVRGGYVL